PRCRRTSGREARSRPARRRSPPPPWCSTRCTHDSGARPAAARRSWRDALRDRAASTIPRPRRPRPAAAPRTASPVGRTPPARSAAGRGRRVSARRYYSLRAARTVCHHRSTLSRFLLVLLFLLSSTLPAGSIEPPPLLLTIDSSPSLGVGQATGVVVEFSDCQ